jgi:predicted DsbA family dithiol-disulfide isomerase
VGRGLGHTPTRLDVAAETGLVRGCAEEMLRGDGGPAEVRTAEEWARRLGVQGVPFFVINSATSLSGAREVSAFLDAEAQGILAFVPAETGWRSC